MRDNSLGVYCVNEKTFYYLESGKVYVAKTVDRLKKTLVKRGLIEFTDRTYLDTDSYKILTCRDAKLEDYKMVPIYISTHVKETATLDTEEPEKKGTWGRKCILKQQNFSFQKFGRL